MFDSNYKLYYCAIVGIEKSDHVRSYMQMKNPNEKKFIYKLFPTIYFYEIYFDFTYYRR